MNAVEEGDANMMGAPYNYIGLRECGVAEIMATTDPRWRQVLGEA